MPLQRHMSTMKLLSTRKNGSGRGRSIMVPTSFTLRDRTPKPFQPTSFNSYLRETWQFLKETRRCSDKFGLLAGGPKIPKFEIFRTRIYRAPLPVLNRRNHCKFVNTSHSSHFSARVLNEDFCFSCSLSTSQRPLD
jgi:hypothetical protein